eukprot:CAMPEP_0170644714 /NCGR_PEP_ID=MMETSP0224-20130122/42645_1 /TAXON_ID=285029 /ORGANISM="Togula jolla, Strain CCCM 725" /LENGTH=64 /DNA_ID=CAMNT_0010975785 /DNA_START=43 /DNA_END=233 /DNA_ORIENTATION=+
MRPKIGRMQQAAIASSRQVCTSSRQRTPRREDASTANFAYAGPRERPVGAVEDIVGFGSHLGIA